jgi:pyruvate kinase
MLEVAKGIAQNNSILSLQKGDLYIVSAGMPYGLTGTTNMILVQKV